MNNLGLWERHMKPHKDALKKFSRGGGFSGTAIDPMWIIREATLEWGPMGSRWGFDVIQQEEYNFPDQPHVLHVVLIRIWYPQPAREDGIDPGVGHIESFGQTMMAGTNKNGFFVDEEAPKKSVTDALTKGLSWLGFGSAVHMGMFDGNKYIDFRKQEPEIVTTDGVEPPPETDANIDEIKALIDANYEIICNRLGNDEGLKWHVLVSKNFLNGKKRSEMNDEELLQLADLQKQRIATLGGE